MPYPLDLSGILIGAPRHTPLRVRAIHSPARARCTAQGVEIGDEIRCLGVTCDHVLVDVAQLGTVHLDLALSTSVEVEPVGRRPAAS
ncbi:MAG TPA: hypothetical protein VHB25_02160 [Gemmatimonadaceae bacterium]|nr:hypothetical protein [Gemmatimonadaceae bacterium]